MNSILKYIGLFLISLPLIMISCDSDDVPDTTANEVVLKNIKILNAGETGDIVVEGQVDEINKQITFPRIDSLTDLSKLRFEAVMSENATLDSLTYDFRVEKGDSEKTKIIKVVNGSRFREYRATVRLIVPLNGADFTPANIKVYDFSGVTKNMYPDLADASTRSADMDLEHVLIVSRLGGTNPHLLKIEDLRNNVINPIKLDLTGVTGNSSETFAVSSGRLSQGHIYISNLAGTAGTHVLRIYHWASSTAKAEKVLELAQGDIPGYVAGRFGDYMSVDINESGDGYIFLGVNGSQSAYKVLRLTVTGFTTVSNPTLINVAVYGGLWGSYNRVDGATNEYMYTGHQGAIQLVNAEGKVSYTIPTTFIPNVEGSDAQIMTFNNERYMAMIATPGAGNIKIYNITKGEDTKDALERLVASAVAPVYQYSLGGSIAAATASGSVAWAKDGDEKLYIFGAGPGAGFAIIELSKKTE